MRPPTFGHTHGVGFNMTPMIDVVFLLIIFFLLSSHLAQREAHLPLPLPDATTAEDAADQLPHRITLNILSDGKIVLAGTTIDQQQLVQRLTRARASSADPLEIRIRADRSVPYRYVAPVLMAASTAEIWNVSFAVHPSREPR